MWEPANHEYSLTPNFAIDALARASLVRQHYRICKRLGPCHGATQRIANITKFEHTKKKSRTTTRTSAGCFTFCAMWPYPCFPSTWQSYCKTRTLKTLHQVCAWNREAKRRNNRTSIPYKISTRTSRQTMLLFLKWYYSLEWMGYWDYSEYCNIFIRYSFIGATTNWIN